MTIGAASCTSCPDSAPYTHGVGVSISDCRVCASEQYSSGGGCVDCSSKCSRAQYEIQGCSATGNRICANCTVPVCTAGEKPLACPSKSGLDGGGCGPCDDALLPRNASYKRSVYGVHCLWECEVDFFSEVGSNICTRCTPISDVNCPRGFRPNRCNVTHDTICTQQCVNSTKPLLNSVWLSNFLSAKSCMWECADNYEAFVSNSGISFCRFLGENRTDTVSVTG